METIAIVFTICFAILLYVLNFVYINGNRKKKDVLSALVDKTFYTNTDIQALSKKIPKDAYVVLIDTEGKIEHHSRNHRCSKLPIEHLYQASVG